MEGLGQNRDRGVMKLSRPLLPQALGTLTTADCEHTGTAITGTHTSRHSHRVAESRPDIIQVKLCLTSREQQGPLNP